MRERWNNLPADARLALRWLAIAAVVLVLAFGGLRLFQSTLPAPRTVTMDGGGEVTTINLWGNYAARSPVTGQVHSGDLVRLIRQSGDACQVERDAATRGWVTCNLFIREFR